MRAKQMNGTKADPRVDDALSANQSSLVDALLSPNPTRLNEMLGARHSIVSKIPAVNPEAQPVQARGRVVWNRAYVFQAHGPSYLDPIPDPRGDHDADDA